MLTSLSEYLKSSSEIVWGEGRGDRKSGGRVGWGWKVWGEVGRQAKKGGGSKGKKKNGHLNMFLPDLDGLIIIWKNAGGH